MDSLGWKDLKDKQAVSFLTEGQTFPWDSWQLHPLQKPKIQNMFGELWNGSSDSRVASLGMWNVKVALKTS